MLPAKHQATVFEFKRQKVLIMPRSKTLLTRTIKLLFSGNRLTWVKLSLLAFGLNIPSNASAETRYVTDRLILNLRSGPTTSYRITRTLSSGTAVNLVEGKPPENGHVLVTVGSNEGWVLEQYLQNEPVARTQVAQLKAQVDSLKNQVTDLQSKLENTAASLDDTAQQQTEVASELEAKEAELQQIKALSANAIAIDQRNTQLTETNQNLQLEIDKLKAENDRLSGSEQRTQWMTGAALVLIGIFCSWIITNFSGRRKSNWS
jgi:SH3 domain protein